MKGIRVRCLKALEGMCEGKFYLMVTLGGCYAFYEGAQMVGTMKGRSTFDEHFQIVRGRPHKHRKRRKKDDNVGTARVST